MHLRVLLDSCSFCSQSKWNLADQLDISVLLQAAVKIMAKELSQNNILHEVAGGLGAACHSNDTFKYFNCVPRVRSVRGYTLSSHSSADAPVVDLVWPLDR